MASPTVNCKTSTPVETYPQTEYLPKPKYCSLPVVKSPVVFNRPRGWHPSTETPRVFIQREKAVPATRQSLNPQMKPSSTITGRHPASYFTASGDLTTSSSACYETAFTSVEPRTRIIPQRCASILRRSRSSERCLDDNPRTRTENASHGVRNAEKSNLYRSLDQKCLDRLRSKSGGYVNVAVYGSADCLDRIGSDSLWYPDDSADTVNSRSISSLSSYRNSAVTGLSPPTQSCDYSDYSASILSASQLNMPPHSSEDSPHGEGLRFYQNSPSKRLIGRRKGLEFYYGAKACRPGLVTAEGKALAIESLQLLTLLLPPDHRRKLHLLLRFMAKVTSNTQLVLDKEIPMKTLMINTFYRCIICSPDESDYDELLAVRLVTFLMENAEAIMVVPHRLCTQVRDSLIDIQRDKV